jgi:hypothetical protein
MYKYLLIILLAIVAFLLMNSRSTKIEPTIITHIDTLYRDTVITKYEKGKDIPYDVIDFIHDSVRISVHDTVSIVKDYLTAKEYKDTLRIDTNNYVSIKDTISENRIIGRSFEAKLKEKTIVITNDIYHPERKAFYMGPILDLRSFDKKLGIGVAAVYRSSPNQLIGVNFTTNQLSFAYYIKF